MNYLNNLLYLLCVAAGLNLPTITTAQNRTNSNQEIKIGVYENDINYDNFKVPAKQYMGHAWFLQKEYELSRNAYQKSVEIRDGLNQLSLSMEPLAGLVEVSIALNEMCQLNGSVNKEPI